jgi:hypothetical protein
MHFTLRTQLRVAAVAALVSAAAWARARPTRWPPSPRSSPRGAKGRSSSGLTFDTAGLVQVAALARDAPLATDYSASALITPKDGG